MKKKTKSTIRGEAEICALLQPIVAKCYLPHLKAFRLDYVPMITLESNEEVKSGFDLFGLEWMACLVRFDGRFQFDQWWKELESIKTKDQDPFLFYRDRRSNWQVVMKMYSEVLDKRFYSMAHIKLDSFLKYFEYRLKYEVDERVQILNLLEKHSK